MAKSYNTTLSVVNFSGKDITSTQVTNLAAYDWDYDPSAGRTDPYRPDLNFQAPIPNLDARCEHEEINQAANGVNFDMKFTFADQSWISFHIDQAQAKEKLADNYSFESSDKSKHLEVYRVTGTDGTGTASNSFYIRESTPPDNSNWMRKLMAKKPDVKLNEITMPGSHDAGLYKDHTAQVANKASDKGGGDWAVTQRGRISWQLKAGARYFDLRVFYDNGGVLWTYHGQFNTGTWYGAYGGKFKTILKDVYKFLSHRDSSGQTSDEVIILRITPYIGWENLQATVELVQQELGSYLYRDSSGNIPDFVNMKLSDLKGKVVATFDSAFTSLLSPAGGVFLNVYRGDPATGSLVTTTDKGMFVYDVYADSNAFPTMEVNQTTKLVNYGGYGKDYLFLFSWTLTGKTTASSDSTTGVLDLLLLAQLANPQLPKKLRQLKAAGPLPNIVHIDFVTPYLCSAIIDLNW